MSEEPAGHRALARSPARGRRLGWSGWTLTAAFALLLPKCLACVVGYLALAVGLAVKAPELCGGNNGAAWAPWWLFGIGGSTFVGALWLASKIRARMSAAADPVR
jgi:hypothetical protein